MGVTDPHKDKLRQGRYACSCEVGLAGSQLYSKRALYPDPKPKLDAIEKVLPLIELDRVVLQKDKEGN